MTSSSERPVSSSKTTLPSRVCRARVADIGGLLGGKAQFAHALGAELEDVGGGDFAVDGGGQAAEDDARDAAAKLLKNDGFDECFEIGFAKFDTIISNAGDNFGQNRVLRLKVLNGLLHGETR